MAAGRGNSARLRASRDLLAAEMRSTQSICKLLFDREAAG
jgi:hypothetical protein